MIIHTQVRKFLANVKKPGSRVVLSELIGKTPVGTHIGVGTIRLEKGRFRIEWRLTNDPSNEEFLSTLYRDRFKPRIYTTEDCWQMSAATEAGLYFEFKAFPPATTHSIDGQMECIALQASSIRTAMREPDRKETERFVERLKAFGFARSGTPLKDEPPNETLHHAIFPLIVSPLRWQQQTAIEFNNPFLGKAGSRKRNDTWLHKREGMTFALVQKKKLHAYLRYDEPELSLDDQKETFTAFLDALAFTHGCRAWPSLREVSIGKVVEECEVRSGNMNFQTSSAPLDDHLFLSHKESEEMLMAAFDFFRSGSPLIGKFKRLQGLLCTAHKGRSVGDIDVLALCTIFEGVIKCLFNHHGLKNATRGSASAEKFESVKTEAGVLLKKNIGSHDLETTPYWNRCIGAISKCGYLDTREIVKAMGEFYGFGWSGDLEDVFKLWNGHRSPLAHGAETETTPESTQEMFSAWSRITGTINRFMLAEMGYTGFFRYSPLEPGRQFLEISKPPDSLLP